MAVYDVQQQAYPTKDEIRDQILNDLVFAYDAQGISINVMPGSDHFMRADAFAGPVSIAIANGRLARAAISPLTAQGDDLLELAAVHGVFARPATFASGYVTIFTQFNGISQPTTTVTIPQGYICTAADGLRYQTTSVNTDNGPAAIEVQALLSGEDGNRPAQSVLTWDSSAVGSLLPKCLVGIGGIKGGADADTVEVVRQRLLQRLASPGIGGNGDHCIRLAQDSSAAIQAAYCYMAVRGPGSVDVAIVAAGGDRTLDADNLALANGALVNELPGNWSINVITVNPEFVDIVFNTDLPLPQSAGGSGGGWRDGSPWPSEITKVTNYTSPVATVNSTVAPVIGNTIGIWDPTTDDADGNAGLMREYTITAVSGPSGAYLIEVEGGFTVSPLNAYVSAGAFALTQYAATARDQFELLGPGEKTDNIDLLPRSKRQPSGDVQGPIEINSRIITGIESEYREIALEYAARYISESTTEILAPSIPSTTADPPNVVVLKYLAFICSA